MLPGKTYTPEDLLQILKRRFWLILLPFAILSAGTAIYARLLPNRYKSTATIVVLPQQVPEAYVKSGVTAKIGDRLPTIYQRIVSRAKLESIIEQFNLYPNERKKGMTQDVYERMRDKDIDVHAAPNSDAFYVSYEGANASTTQQVAESLASLFKEQNARDRERLSEGTTTFLETQLNEARRRLQEQEQLLRKFQEEHAGSLPSQLQSNSNTLQNTWQNIQATAESISHDKDRRLVLEKQQIDLASETPTPTPTPTALVEANANNPDSIPAGPTSVQLTNARNQLAALERRGFLAADPRVSQLKKQIAALEATADAEALQKPVSPTPGATPTASPAEVARLAKLASITREMEQIDRQIANKEEEKKKLQAITASLQPKIDGVPGLEADLTNLMRDYNVLQSVYTGMLAKKEESNISQNLERQEIGEQFNIAEPARVPERPSSPNRQQIDVIGMAAGIALGLLMVGLLEYRDSSFKTDADVSRLLALPVLAVVPVMQSDAEGRRVGVRRWLVGAGLGSVVAVCLAVVVYTFVR